MQGSAPAASYALLASAIVQTRSVVQYLPSSAAALNLRNTGNGVCFSPRQLFPADKQWGRYDTRDVCNKTHVIRSFFDSTNATCANQTGFAIHMPVPVPVPVATGTGPRVRVLD